ncbi:MAG TPA: LPS assembly lipoprotein LptE [Gammaproteobacteria bacterium]
MWLSDYSGRCCRLCLLLCLAALAACGFSLRGAHELPPGMAKTFLQAENSGSALTVRLKRALRDASVWVVEYPANDAAVLKTRESSQRRVLSVGTDGKALEYEVQYSATFSLTLPGSESPSEKTISLSRDYIFDRRSVLAIDEEEATLIKDMQRELARMILEQLAAYPQQSLPSSKN